MSFTVIIYKTHSKSGYITDYDYKFKRGNILGI